MGGLTEFITGTQRREAEAARQQGGTPVPAQDTGGKRDLSSLVPNKVKDDLAACMRGALVTNADGSMNQAATRVKQNECRGR